MEVLIKFIHLTIFLVGLASSSVLPAEKCKLEDSKCLKKVFQEALPIVCNGISELEIEVLDPLHMEDLAFDISGLQFSLKDGQMKGLKGAVFDRVKWDLKKKRLEIDYHLNSAVRGMYTAGGRVLILPITGDGVMKLRLKNIAIQMSIDYKMDKDADGKDHVLPTKYDFTFDVKDGAHFNLSNLFNGNKDLGDAMHSFLNDNWQQVSQEFGRPMMDGAAKILFKNIKHFFKNVPLEDIADV